MSSFCTCIRNVPPSPIRSDSPVDVDVGLGFLNCD